MAPQGTAAVRSPGVDAAARGGSVLARWLRAASGIGPDPLGRRGASRKAGYVTHEAEEQIAGPSEPQLEPAELGATHEVERHTALSFCAHRAQVGNHWRPSAR